MFIFALALLAPGASVHGQSSLHQTVAPQRPGVAPPAAPSPAELKAPPPGAARLPSGIATLRLRAGKAATKPPRPQDIVFFRAIGRRPDGTVVQDGFASPDPQKLLYSKLFPSWQEAMAGMTEGEQRRFWFPAALTPKNTASGEQTPLVFDVELVRVGKMPDPPASVAKPDPKATRVGLGTSILTVTPGKAGPKLTRADGALVEFTVWNPIGQALNSSVADGRPTLFPLDRVMGSFADCLVGMAVAEKRVCWIPAERNEGFPGAGRGALTFEIELLQIVDTAKLFQSKSGSGSRP